MSVVESLKIQIHVLSVWCTLLIGFGSVWIFPVYLHTSYLPFSSVLDLQIGHCPNTPTFSSQLNYSTNLQDPTTAQPKEVQIGLSITQGQGKGP